ncbi:hypothetical protein [Streptomyces sp. NPDC001781]
MEQCLDQQARDLSDATQPADAWEETVALVLRALRRPAEPRTRS